MAIYYTYCGHAAYSLSGMQAHLNGLHSGIIQQLIKLAAKHRQENNSMGKSISDVKGERGIGGPPMLRGQDVPRSLSQIKIKVKEMREAPSSFKSPFIIDLAEPVYEREAFAVNITNLRALATLAGMDPETADVDKLCKWVAGKTLPLFVTMTNNPQSKKMVRSLFFDADTKN